MTALCCMKTAGQASSICTQRRKSATVPQLREHIAHMKQHGPQWEKLADNWVELEALYASERGKDNCPKTYALLTKCVK